MHLLIDILYDNPSISFISLSSSDRFLEHQHLSKSTRETTPLALPCDIPVDKPSKVNALESCLHLHVK